MPTIAVAARAPVITLPRVPAELPATPVSLSRARRWWDRLTFWPAEFLGLVALIYMLPIVIYAIGIPIALVINALFLLVGGSWRGFWQ